MSGITHLPSTNVGEELRRIIAGRLLLRRRLKLLAFAVSAVVPALATTMLKPPVLLVWNASSSAPIGLYRVELGAVVRSGDMVIAWTPPDARSFASERRYLPANVPLVKRVAAVGGDKVCARGRIIRINGQLVTTRLERDSSGRPMPWWHGCVALAAGEYFLLMDSPRSFDGRYFGITNERELIGRAKLLWRH